MKKLYTITKYVVARTVQEALRLEKKTPVDDVYLDPDWRKANIAPPASESPTGFKPK